MGEQKSVIIIGAGVAGLTAGFYAQASGYRTTIFEKHTLPGGLCTGWTRKGYTFDGCLHWLTGIAEGQQFNAMWRELGVIQGKRMTIPEEHICIKDAEGKEFRVYTDIDRLEAHMLEISPEDADVIKEFTSAVRFFIHHSSVPYKPASVMSMGEIFKLIVGSATSMGPMTRWTKTGTREFASRFRSPFLREVFPYIIFAPDFPMTAALNTLAGMTVGNCGLPDGGSLGFARTLADNYVARGGQIKYNSRVDEVLIENGAAVGVRLADGSEHRADYVISAADGHWTIFDLLQGKYVTDIIKDVYNTATVSGHLLLAYVGVNRDLSGTPASQLIYGERLVPEDGKADPGVAIRHYCYDPSMAPAGKSAVLVSCYTTHEYWRDLHQNPERYQAAKAAALERALDVLEQVYPGIRADVEVTDVATPMTIVRYTNNWQGAFMGWRSSEKLMKFTPMGISRTLPGLNNFFMAGQWCEAFAGVPGAALSGRYIAQMICKQDKVKFPSSLK